MRFLADHTIEHTFGTINPSQAPGGGALGFLQFGQGSEGISNFLTALVNLAFVIAAVIFVILLLWGALEWMLSGGEKEKVEGARNRLTHAFVGLLILAVAFAILQLLGQFTGFKFFK